MSIGANVQWPILRIDAIDSVEHRRRNERGHSRTGSALAAAAGAELTAENRAKVSTARSRVRDWFVNHPSLEVAVS